MQKKLSNYAIIQVIARLKQVFNVSTDSELAERLGVKQNTISTWKSRGTIDYSLVIANCDNIDLNWLFGGDVEKKSENFPEKKVHPESPPRKSTQKRDMSIQNVRLEEKGVQSQTSKLTGDFVDGGWSDAMQIEVLNRHIKAQDEIIATKNELLAAKDQTITAQKEALKLLEGQINVSTALMEKFAIYINNESKKRPTNVEVRTASDVAAKE